jgi:hypothetical protein
MTLLWSLPIHENTKHGQIHADQDYDCHCQNDMFKILPRENQSFPPRLNSLYDTLINRGKIRFRINDLYQKHQSGSVASQSQHYISGSNQHFALIRNDKFSSTKNLYFAIKAAIRCSKKPFPLADNFGKKHIPFLEYPAVWY